MTRQRGNPAIALPTWFAVAASLPFITALDQRARTPKRRWNF